MLSLQTPELTVVFFLQKKSQRGQSERLGNNSVSLKKQKNKQGFSKSCLFFVALSPLTSLDTPQTHENYSVGATKPSSAQNEHGILSYFVKTAEVKASTPPYKNTIQTASSWM